MEAVPGDDTAAASDAMPGTGSGEDPRDGPVAEEDPPPSFFASPDLQPPSSAATGLELTLDGNAAGPSAVPARTAGRVDWVSGSNGGTVEGCGANFVIPTTLTTDAAPAAAVRGQPEYPVWVPDLDGGAEDTGISLPSIGEKTPAPEAAETAEGSPENRRLSTYVSRTHTVSQATYYGPVSMDAPSSSTEINRHINEAAAATDTARGVPVMLCIPRLHGGNINLLPADAAEDDKPFRVFPVSRVIFVASGVEKKEFIGFSMPALRTGASTASPAVGSQGDPEVTPTSSRATVCFECHVCYNAGLSTRYTCRPFGLPYGLIVHL